MADIIIIVIEQTLSMYCIFMGTLNLYLLSEILAISTV